MARKKNTEAPVTEEVKTQDPTVTSETPVISNEESEKQEQDTVETPDTSSIKESSQKPEKKDKTKEKDEIPEFVKNCYKNILAIRHCILIPKVVYSPQMHNLIG